MSGDGFGRVRGIVGILENQMAKLRRIHDEYTTEFDAVFDEYGAMTSLQRWADRTTKLIREHVSEVETAEFQRALSAVPKGRGSWHWREVCQYLDTHLLRLAEDIQENPDDPSFGNSNVIAPSQTTGMVSAVNEYDVFLSYSTRDKDEARGIYNALETAGKKCFMAEKSLQPGDTFPGEIQKAVAASAEIWIVISQNSIQSDWVKHEVGAAWGLSKRTIPILLRCAPNQLPPILGNIHAIDYHNVYEYIRKMR